MLNLGIQISALIRLRTTLQSTHKIPKILNTCPLHHPKITTLPPSKFQKSGGSPVEQTTEQDQNHENHDDETPQQVNEENDNNTQKTQKDTNTSTDNDIQRTPEISQNTPLQEEPINTRGEKYNLRPNPNPNYSDSYRY